MRMRYAHIYAAVYGALFLLAPLTSHAFSFSDVTDWYSGASVYTGTAATVAASAPWLDIKADDSDGPLPVYDGMETTLTWASQDIFGTTNCSITYPGQSGAVTEQVAFSGSETVVLYPSNSPLQYAEVTCTHGGEVGHDVVLITKIDKPAVTTPSPSSGNNYTGAGVRPTTGGGGIQVITVGVPVTSGNTFQYTGGTSGGGGSISFGGIVQTVMNAPGTISNAVSGFFNNTTNNTGVNRISYGITHANNAVQTYFTQPTQNWLNNHIIDPLRNFLGLGNGQTQTGGGTGGNGQDSAQGSSNSNRNTHNGAPSGSSGGSTGGAYQVHVGPLSSGASEQGTANDCNGGTDNCNNNNDPYGFEQDGSQVQNTNDSR